MSWIVLEADGRRQRIAVARSGSGVWVGWPGGAAFIQPASGVVSRDAMAREGAVCAPLTGRVIRVDVAAGAEVAAGQSLVVLEAMKMEHNLTSPRAGAVAEINCAVGDLVDQGAMLVELAEE